MSCGIRKCVLVLSLFLAASFLFAQEQDAAGSGDLDFYYYNLPIVRIFRHNRGYYIVYRTHGAGFAAMCVPWEWFSNNESRAVYMPVKAGIQPYVSYITNNGEFYQIRINAPADTKDAIWGKIGPNNVPNENFDVDTLTLKF